MGERVTEFLDDLDDMFPNGVWVLVDVVGGALAFGFAWSAFADGRWFIVIATVLAGVYFSPSRLPACAESSAMVVVMTECQHCEREMDHFTADGEDR